MKLFTCLCLLAVIATARPAFAQATIHGDLSKDWAGQKTLLVTLANAMPEDKYGFKATPAQRTFGEHVLHIAQINVMLTKALGGKTPEPACGVQQHHHPGDDSGAVPWALDPGTDHVLPQRAHTGHVRPDGGVSALERPDAAGQRATAVSHAAPDSNACRRRPPANL